MTVKNQIKMYMHCAQCLKILPRGESPESFARISVGSTGQGFQVWCNRHNINIAVIEADSSSIHDMECSGCGGH